MKDKHTNAKEMYAAAKSLESLPEEVQHCRVDVHADIQVTIHVQSGRATRSRELTPAAKHIFQFVTQRHLALTMSHVSLESLADLFSRNLSKSHAMSSPSCRELVESEFGGRVIIWILCLWILTPSGLSGEIPSLILHFILLQTLLELLFSTRILRSVMMLGLMHMHSLFFCLIPLLAGRCVCNGRRSETISCTFVVTFN